MVRTSIEDISVQGRNTQGVRVIRLKEGEHVVGVEQIDEPEDDLLDADAENTETNSAADDSSPSNETKED